MAKSYVKNPNVSEVFLPGIGKLEEGRVLTGDQYAKLCPLYLVELIDGKAPEAVGAVPVTGTITSPQLNEQLPVGGVVPVEPPKQVLTETQPQGDAPEVSEDEKSPKARKTKSSG